LLSLARAESGSTHISRSACDLAALASDVIVESLPHALDKHIDLGYEGISADQSETFIQGNATLLKEMLRNLVDNAINYTPSSELFPGVVTVRVLADALGGVVLLQVEDSGPGISEAEHDLVFQPFYRALGTEADGSGLGLSIVQEIAHQHAATVTLESVAPQRTMPGARFTVRFQI
jgi:two-component system sensor histidine kinase TctE